MPSSSGIKNKKFFVKVYFVCILIISLYTLIAVGLFFFKNVQELEREWNRNVHRTVEQMGQQMDIRLEVAFNLVYQMRRSSEFVSYSNFTELNYYNITTVANLLQRNSEAFGEYGYKIDVLKPYDDRLVVTPNGTMSKEAYYNEMSFSEEQVKQINDYAANSSYSEVLLLKRAKPFSRGNNFDPVSIVKKELSGLHDLLFVISFFESTFYPELGQMESQIYSVGLLSDEHLVDVKTMNGDYLIPDEDAARTAYHASSSPGASREEGNITYEADGLLLVQSSALNQLQYIFTAHEYMWRPAMSGLLFHSGIAFSLLLVLGAGVAFLASRNIYKPIQNVLSIFRTLDQGKSQLDEAPQRTDDMSFIAETAMTISRMNNSLKETIQNNRLSLKHNFLRDTLYGIASEEQIRLQAAQYELEEYMGGLTVVVMELMNARDLDQQFPLETVAEIKSGTFRIILEELKLHLQLELVELEHKRYALVIKEQQLDRLKKTISHVLLGIETDIGIRVVASIGRPVVSLTRSEDSYRDAIRLLEYRVALDRNSVITANDTVLQNTDKYYYPLDQERDLIAYVFQGKPDQVVAILDRILDENMNKRQISGEMLSHFIFALNVTIHRILHQMNESYGDIFGDSSTLYDELKRYNNGKLVRERIHEVFRVIMNSMTSRNEELDQTITEQILDHIHSNFNEDISLTDIAEQFNLSIGHTSYLFKKDVGENFKEYLNQYRVKKAKELLNGHKSISINEVATRVGCNNVNTFIRIFKKYEGVPPGHYAKKTE